MTQFIPISNIEYLEKNHINLENLGKSHGFLGFHKIYLVYDSIQKCWGIKNLNLFQRIVRKLFGSYEETYKATLKKHLIKFDLPKAIRDNPKILSRIQTIWKGTILKVVSDDIDEPKKKEIEVVVDKIGSKSNSEPPIGDPSYTLFFLLNSEKYKIEFMKIIESIRSQGHKLNIFEKDDQIFQYHSRHEINAWIGCFPKLKSFYYGGKCILNEAGKISEKRMLASVFQNKDDSTLDFWTKKLEALDVQKFPSIKLPAFNSFSGSKIEMNALFTSLLANQNGLIIGEKHCDKAPKQVLIEQMPHLYELGVRTFFLEHCCFDTLQPELDDFYEKKVPSSFLEDFLTNGCEGSVSEENYFEIVNAAVQAGIRPVGLETSKTQGIGYHSFVGSQGAPRMIGMNMPAKVIIEKEAIGKYMALVGSAHASHCNGVPGLSELCQVPSIIIEDTRLKNKVETSVAYFPDCVNLNLDDENVKKILKNPPDKEHRVNAYIRIKPLAELS